MSFPVHTLETAPAGSRDTLGAAQKAYGFIPNLLAVMAEAPALVKGYTTLSRIFDETSFSATERQVVLLTVSYENGCAYCVAAHSVIAGAQKVPHEVVQALRSNEPIRDAKLEALRRFTSSTVKSRGWPPESDIAAFSAAGYEPQHVLEVVLGVGLKTLSNYMNHLTNTPLDQAFSKASWSKAA